jgi:hypothetical protein
MKILLSHKNFRRLSSIDVRAKLDPKIDLP